MKQVDKGGSVGIEAKIGYQTLYAMEIPFARTIH